MAKKFSMYEKYMKEFKKSKVKKEKSYSSYWMFDDWYEKGNTSRFSGLSSDVKTSGGSDIVKLIKLTSYQRAIANFVKIVTKQDIPVVFGGNTSATNGKRVVLASDISDKNFDVVVGLALHEGSHIKLTDFNLWTKHLEEITNPSAAGYLGEQERRAKKDILNIIEDRRIDDYVFRSSPGYRAYYHKMYEHYFYSDEVTKGIASDDFRDPTNMQHYLFRLANITNPLTDLDALPGFREIYNMIDVKNIGRLKSTQDALQLTNQVYEKIQQYIADAESNQGGGSGNSTTGGGKDKKGGNQADQSKQNSDMGGANTDLMDVLGELSDQDSGSDAADSDNAGNTNTVQLSDKERQSVQRAWDKQRAFLEGDVNKKLATKKLQNQLEEVSKMDLDIQVVGDNVKGFKCVVYDLVNKSYVRQVMHLSNKCNAPGISDSETLQIKKEYAAISNHHLQPNRIGIIAADAGLPLFFRGKNSAYVNKGLELGSLLGRKLQVRNEERSLVFNRLVSGNIDSKRLAHAGYGIETVFKQVHIDRYKQAILNISLDLSSSMNGKKWCETVQMCSAIVKAATYVQNLRVQVNARTTQGNRGELPVLILCYDSKVNNMKQFIDVMSCITPSGTTPEGLCFDALMKTGNLATSNSECTSYFLNISDGEPGMAGWHGNVAVAFTRKMVQKMMRDYGANIISFFVSDYSSKQEPSQTFRNMYGKDSRMVSADNVVQIARELNQKFLSEGKYTS